MIRVEKIKYSVAGREILSDISFEIGNGKKVALVGPNGTGKSTLIKILTKHIDPQDGKIIISKDVKEIGYMPQQLEDLGDFPSETVLDFMLSGRGLDKLIADIQKKLEEMNKPGIPMGKAEKLSAEYTNLHEKFMEKNGYAAENELLQCLIGMDLSDIDLDRSVDSLSGGQKTKLTFARVLFSNPDLMILDEPTNHLDESTIDWVVNYLKKYKGSLLLVSHTPSILDELAMKVVFLDGTGSALVLRGNLTEFTEKKAKLDKATEHLYKKQQKQLKTLDTFIDRWRGTTKKKVAQVRDREKKKARLRAEMVNAPSTIKTISLDFPVRENPHQKVLEIKNLSKSYDENKVLQDVSFAIHRGERMAIMGPNGAGKTTLFKLITGLLKTDQGTITFGGKVDKGYYAQEHELLNPNNTVLEEFSSVSTLVKNNPRSILAHFLFPGERVFSRVTNLSPGEKSRLALAKHVVAGHNFLILDEPTNHLDFLAREKVKEALRDYKGTILIISHDQEFMKGIGVEKVLSLPENRIGYLDQVVRK